MHEMVEDLAKTMVLGALLEKLGPYELVDHWQQGEFHHDVVLRARGRVYVVATNCNGGVKEVLAFDDVPDRWALWHHRCPERAHAGWRVVRSLANAPEQRPRFLRDVGLAAHERVARVRDERGL